MNAFERLPKQLLAASVLALLFALPHGKAGVIRGFGEPGPVSLGRTTANYLAVNREGLGHFLIAPYFSAQAGNTSLLSLTNTDPLNGKAVKILFRGAGNGDLLHTLSVLLAPNDVWNAIVYADAVTGSAVLASADGSCTFPSLSNGALHRFSTSRLNPGLTAADKAVQTLEGYIEVVNMADIPSLGTVAITSGSLAQSIQHGAKQARNCSAPAVLLSQADVSTEIAAASLGYATPTTGLQGSLTIVNVPLTLTFSTDMVAIEARDNATAKAGRANFVLFPQKEEPVPSADGLSADPALRSKPLSSKSVTGESATYQPVTGSLPIVQSFLSDFPDLSTPYLTGLTTPELQAIQLHQVLAVKSVLGDFSSEDTIGAASDWVLAMPSRRYTVGLDYRQTSPTLVYSSSPTPGGGEYFSGANTSVDRALICSKLEGQTYFDRNALQQSGFANVPAQTDKLCGAVPVMIFGSRTALSGKLTTFPAGTVLKNGWASLNTPNALILRSTVEKVGLPILGASFFKASNPSAAPGVSGNYGMTFSYSFGR